MLLRRVLSAAVGIPVIVALILIGGVPYTVAVAVILALGVLEFYAATDPETSATSAAYPRLRRAAPTLFGQRMPAFAGCGGVVLLVAAAYGGLDELTGALAGLIAGVFLILLIIFIAQNLNDAPIHFLGLNGKVSIGLALLLAGV